MLAKNTHDKYRKYRKDTKCNKIPDLQRKEAKKGPEMSPNIAKIAKVKQGFFLLVRIARLNSLTNRIILPMVRLLWVF